MTFSPTALLVIRTTATSEGALDAWIARGLTEMQGEAVVADQPLPRLLTQSEFAEAWGCSVRTVMRMCANGEIEFIRLGKRMIRIPETELFGKGGSR